MSSCVNLSTLTEYEAYSSSTRNITFQLTVQGAAARVERAPVDIVLALDRSGSMGGEKIALAKAAGLFVLKQLKVGSGDRVGLVSFGSQVTTDCDVSSDGARVEAALRRLGPTDMTNGSGALLEAKRILENAAPTKDTSRVQSILLLTDGAFNVGITDRRQLDEIMRAQLKGTKISLFTFGIGSDYNEDMLQDLAEAGNGHTYHITGRDDMGFLFADALGGLLSVVAQNMVLETKSGECINVGDVYAEEKRDFLLTTPADKAAVKARYFDVRAGAWVETDYLPALVTYGAKQSAEPVQAIREHRARLEAVDIFNETQPKVKRERIKQWKANYASIKSAMLAELEGNMDEAVEEMSKEPSSASWAKKHKAKAYMAQKQRATTKGPSCFSTSSRQAVQGAAKAQYGNMLSEFM